MCEIYGLQRTLELTVYFAALWECKPIYLLNS